MPPYFFRLEKSSGFCHPLSIPTRPSFLGCHNWRQISGVLDGQWHFTESLRWPRVLLAAANRQGSFSTYQSVSRLITVCDGPYPVMCHPTSEIVSPADVV